MYPFLIRFLFILLLFSPAVSAAQNQEKIEEKLINKKIDSLLENAVLAVSNLEYIKAIDLFSHSRDLAERINHEKRIALASGTLAKLHFQLQDYDNAILENERAITEQKEVQSFDLLGQSYITAARIALVKNLPQQTSKNIELGIEALSKSKRSDLKAEILLLNGDLLRKNNKNTEAIPIYDKAIKEASIANTTYLKAQAQANKAISLANTRQLNAAEEILLEVENFTKDEDYPAINIAIYQTKSLIAQGKGNYKEANDYLKSYYNALQNIRNNSLSSSTILPEKKNEHLREIVQSLDSDIIKEKDRAAETMRLTLILSIALCCILALLTITLYKNNTVRAKANELLEEKNIELVVARDNAEKASRVKAQFLSTITHELRTPMYAVTGLTHLLLSENPTDEQKKHLDSLKFSGEYLLSLINNILDLNKLEANKVEVEETIFYIKKRIEDVLFALEKSAKDKGNTLQLDFDDDIPLELMGDPLMISQILINLVGNAIKFTRNGEVLIRVQKNDQGASDINLHFEIEDNGEGISKKKQKSIFQNFTQGSVAIHRKFGGTGLGLSIVKNLLDLLNSKITLESTLGKGTIFKFDIKYNLTQELAGQENKDKVLYEIDYMSLENKHILVVEDNKINQMITRKILEKNKISCETANNGEIAVEKVRTTTFDLILMDIHMPGISGVEATEQIRQFNKDIPILALTAVTIDKNLDEFYEVGFNDIIPKPYKIEEFFQKIDNGLKNSRVLN